MMKNNFIAASANITDMDDEAKNYPIVTKVEKGVNLTDAMAETGLFPDAAIQLSRTGGDTGNYDIMLDKAADFLTADNARKVKSIMSLVEPAVILFAGCVIALIIFALISVTMSLNASFI